jgi:predicted nucleotidyltransferase
MSQLQYHQIKSYLHGKQAMQAELNEAIRLSELNNTVEILQKYFTNIAVNVYLFGSICHKGLFFANSDIDIAVSSFQGNRIDLYCELSILFKREIDLVFLEKTSIKEFILNDSLQIV